MTKIQKDILFWSALALIVTLVSFLGVGINVKLNTAVTGNTVTFQGEGKISAAPDVAVINFSIITEGLTSKEAQDANSPKSEAVVDFIKKQGISDKDIKTTSYNIFPRYSYPRFDGPKIEGYEVNQGLEVKIRDLARAGDILSGLVDKGVNNVGQLQFTIDDVDKLKAEARFEAIKNAKNKANELETQLGIRLGRIIDFSESASGYPGPIPFAAEAILKDTAVPELPAGENEIISNVTLTYQIK